MKKGIIIFYLLFITISSFAKGYLDKQSFIKHGETYYRYTVVRVDTLREAQFTDSAFYKILNDITFTIFRSKISDDRLDNKLFVTVSEEDSDVIEIGDKWSLYERGARLCFPGYVKVMGKTIVLQKEICDKYCIITDKTLSQTYKYSWTTQWCPDDKIVWRLVKDGNIFHLYGPIFRITQEQTYESQL